MPSIKLACEAAPLPNNFVGGPQALFEAMIDRLRVIFPIGQFTFVISDTEPVGNQGPWLKDGLQWYVWDDATSTYIPLDISPSLPFIVSDTEPADGEKPYWLRYSGTRVIGWYYYLSGSWRTVGITRGTTAQRPLSPVEYERYWDTDIETEIHYVGGSWKTVAGQKGDIKQVVSNTLAEALLRNPGWQEIGGYLADDAARGRAFVAAHKDPGGAPVADLAAGAGITKRAAREKFGAESVTLAQNQLPATLNVTAVDTNNLDNAGTTGGTQALLSDTEYAEGLANVSAELDNAGGGQAVSLLQPSIAFWTLVKT
jgi:hypothetical protein